MKYIVLFGLSTALLVSACHELPETPENTKIYFTGITTMDSQGFPLGMTDTLDWRLDDQWVEQEAGLFPANNLSLCAKPSDSLEAYVVFPNPCSDAIYFGFRTPVGTDWYMRIVDENFNVLKSYDWITPPPNYNSIIFKTDSLPKDTVRLYYEAIKGACIWRGHGDILITN